MNYFLIVIAFLGGGLFGFILTLRFVLGELRDTRIFHTTMQTQMAKSTDEYMTIIKRLLKDLGISVLALSLISCSTITTEERFNGEIEQAFEDTLMQDKKERNKNEFIRRVSQECVINAGMSNLSPIIEYLKKGEYIWIEYTDSNDWYKTYIDDVYKGYVNDDCF